MTKKDVKKNTLSEAEIDRRVISQADVDDAWEPAIHRTIEPAALPIPAELAVRAAFLARLHRRASVEDWLMHIIRERVELEEAAFADARQALSTRGG